MDDDALHQQYCALADEALDRDEVVVGMVDGMEVAAVPDVVVAEGEAIYGLLPETPILKREDGRSVRFFRMPGAGGRHLFLKGSAS